MVHSDFTNSRMDKEAFGSFFQTCSFIWRFQTRNLCNVILNVNFVGTYLLTSQVLLMCYVSEIFLLLCSVQTSRSTKNALLPLKHTHTRILGKQPFQPRLRICRSNKTLLIKAKSDLFSLYKIKNPFCESEIVSNIFLCRKYFTLRLIWNEY